MSTELELNLRLDSNCRTAFDPTTSNHRQHHGQDHHDVSPSSPPSPLTLTLATDINNHNETNTGNDYDYGNGNGNNKNRNIELDYSSKTVLTSLADESNVTITCTDTTTTTTTTTTTSSNSTEHQQQQQQQQQQHPRNISNTEKQEMLDDLLFDCEITDCALLPRTFWIPCNNKPRCSLEQCALEIFHHHVKKGHVYDPATSGAEWWVQIRPSPPAGRYKLLVQDAAKIEKHKDDDNNNNDDTKRNNCESNTALKSSTLIKTTTAAATTTHSNEAKEDEDDITRNGICFHWDKDEDLRLLMDGKMYIHPHISTVTYFSNIGAPTMALNYRVNPFTGEYILPTNDDDNDDDQGDVEGFISWPNKGKHLSFDGRYLHAAPSDFMPKGMFENQIKLPNDNDIEQKNRLPNDTEQCDEKISKNILQRRSRRVTFLVNVWLNYKPFNVNVFPESMIDKLSKKEMKHILFKHENEAEENRQCPAKEIPYNKSYKCNKEFQWEMGNSDDDFISMQIPIDLVQNEIGGNVRLTWKANEDTTCGIKLSAGGKEDLNDQAQKKRRLN